MRDRVSRRSCSGPQFSDGRSRRGGNGGRDARGVRPVEFFAERLQLALLELADHDPAPPLGGADDRRIHQLQHRPLAEGVRNDLRPPALFEEQPLEEIRGSNDAPVAEREAQMRDAGLEVVPEALHHRGQLALVSGDEILAQHRGKSR